MFNDPTLTNLVERSIAHNHDLRIAAANVRQVERGGRARWRIENESSECVGSIFQVDGEPLDTDSCDA